MSLDYNYIFSQIDKAKKKKPKHYVPWNSPESKKLQEENAKKEEAKPKTGRARGYGYVSEHATRVPGKTRGPGKKTGKESESTTRVPGKTRGPGKKTGKGEKTTRDSNRGRGTDNARTIAERKEHDRMREVDEKIRVGMTVTPYGHTNIRDYENLLFEQGRANEKKRNADNKRKRELADRTRGPGETADEYQKRITAKKKPKKKKVKPVEGEHEMIDESEVDTIADDDDEDTDIGPILQNRNRSTPLWKAWLLKKRRKDRNRLQEINDQDLDNPVGRTKQPRFWKERAEEIKESRLAAEQKKRENDPKFQVDTKEGESYKKYKERQDTANDPREYKTLDERLNEGDVKADEYITAQMAKKKPKATTPPKTTTTPPKATTTPPGKKQQPGVKPKPASSTKKPASVSTPDTSKRDESKLTNLTTMYDPKKDKPAKEDHTVTFADAEKSLWKAWLKNKEEIPRPGDERGKPEWMKGDETKHHKFLRTANEKQREDKQRESDGNPTVEEQEDEEMRLIKWKKLKKPHPKHTWKPKDAAWKSWLEKKVMTEDEKIELDLDDDIAVKEKERYDVPLPRVGESDVPCEESEGGCGGHHDTPSLLAIDMAKRRGLIDSESRNKPKHGYPLENRRGHVLPNLTEDVINDKKDKLTNRGKAGEGIGGMNMGSQRGLGHEAGYKQSPGQTAQITEVNEEKEKSAYETSEQGSNESTDVEPNKRQAPASKPGMDVIRSMYKKALIIKYNNIYKAANI